MEKKTLFKRIIPLVAIVGVGAAACGPSHSPDRSLSMQITTTTPMMEDGTLVIVQETTDPEVHSAFTVDCLGVGEHTLNVTSFFSDAESPNVLRIPDDELCETGTLTTQDAPEVIQLLNAQNPDTNPK